MGLEDILSTAFGVQEDLSLARENKALAGEVLASTGTLDGVLKGFDLAKGSVEQVSTTTELARALIPNADHSHALASVLQITSPFLLGTGLIAGGHGFANLIGDIDQAISEYSTSGEQEQLLSKQIDKQKETIKEFTYVFNEILNLNIPVTLSKDFLERYEKRGDTKAFVEACLDKDNHAIDSLNLAELCFLKGRLLDGDGDPERFATLARVLDKVIVEKMQFHLRQAPPEQQEAIQEKLNEFKNILVLNSMTERLQRLLVDKQFVLKAKQFALVSTILFSGMLMFMPVIAVSPVSSIHAAMFGISTAASIGGSVSPMVVSGIQSYLDSKKASLSNSSLIQSDLSEDNPFLVFRALDEVIATKQETSKALYQSLSELKDALEKQEDRLDPELSKQLNEIMHFNQEHLEQRIKMRDELLALGKSPFLLASARNQILERLIKIELDFESYQEDLGEYIKQVKALKEFKGITGNVDESEEIQKSLRQTIKDAGKALTPQRDELRVKCTKLDNALKEVTDYIQRHRSELAKQGVAPVELTVKELQRAAASFDPNDSVDATYIELKDFGADGHEYQATSLERHLNAIILDDLASARKLLANFRVLHRKEAMIGPNQDVITTELEAQDALLDKLSYFLKAPETSREDRKKISEIAQKVLANIEAKVYERGAISESRDRLTLTHPEQEWLASVLLVQKAKLGVIKDVKELEVILEDYTSYTDVLYASSPDEKLGIAKKKSRMEIITDSLLPFTAQQQKTAKTVQDKLKVAAERAIKQPLKKTFNVSRELVGNFESEDDILIAQLNIILKEWIREDIKQPSEKESVKGSLTRADKLSAFAEKLILALHGNHYNFQELNKEFDKLLDDINMPLTAMPKGDASTFLDHFSTSHRVTTHKPEFTYALFRKVYDEVHQFNPGGGLQMYKYKASLHDCSEHSPAPHIEKAVEKIKEAFQKDAISSTRKDGLLHDVFVTMENESFTDMKRVSDLRAIEFLTPSPENPDTAQEQPSRDLPKAQG